MGMWFANDLILCNKEAEKVDARRKRMKKTLGCEAKAKQNQNRGCDTSWHYQKCQTETHSQKNYSERLEVPVFKFFGTVIGHEGGCEAKILKIGVVGRGGKIYFERCVIVRKC